MDGTTLGISCDQFTTKNDTVRIINLPETTNVRDLGGWAVNGGTGTVKYGLVYRGAAMSRRQGYIINGEGREYACRFLNIAKEIGLGVGYDYSPISETTAFVDLPVNAYANGLENSGANYVNALEEILETLTGSSSGDLQPDETADGAVIFHCAGGADRTGTLSFLLLGLLGVSESDLAKEYELTSFEKGENRRVRNNQEQYAPMVAYIKTLAGATLKDKIEGWWLANGATAQQISTFRGLMIQ